MASQAKICKGSDTDIQHTDTKTHRRTDAQTHRQTVDMQPRRRTEAQTHKHTATQTAIECVSYDLGQTLGQGNTNKQAD